MMLRLLLSLGGGLALALGVGALSPVAVSSAQAQHQPPARGVGVAMKSYAEIKAMTDAKVGGRLIGSDFDAETFTYQMRYMRGNEIIDVVVDARSGRIVGGRENM